VRSDTRIATLGLVLGLLVTPLVPSKSAQALEPMFPKKPHFSRYADRHFPSGSNAATRIYSMDAGT
jgi:hypothetical protein